MAVYKEEKTNTWRVIYRYTDWTGEKKQTQKRGLAQYKSVRSKLRIPNLEQENDRLRKRIHTYEEVISNNNLWHFFKESRNKNRSRDNAR